jgi:hypothetical protein
MSDAKGGADVYLSRRVIEQGWEARWWLHAPVYHYPRATLRSLVREFRRFGFEETYREKRDQTNGWKWNRGSLGVIAHLGSPVIGVMLAVRFRNPLHLVVYPVARYAWVAGYIAGSHRARKHTALPTASFL